MINTTNTESKSQHATFNESIFNPLLIKYLLVSGLATYVYAMKYNHFKDTLQHTPSSHPPVPCDAIKKLAST